MKLGVAPACDSRVSQGGRGALCLPQGSLVVVTRVTPSLLLWEARGCKGAGGKEQQAHAGIHSREAVSDSQGNAER